MLGISQRKRNIKLNLRGKEALTGWAYAILPLAGFFTFYVVPFGITVVKTFYNGFSFVGMSNYINVFYSSAFRLAIGNTFKFIGVGIPIIMVFSLIIALMLNARLKGFEFFRTVFVLPLVLPAASVILAFQILFENGGFVNYALTAMGLNAVDFLHSENTFWVLIILYVWKNAGYSVILILSGLNSIPGEYYEAARVDGANGFKRLVKITVPLLTPTFFFVMVVAVINSFKTFREAYALCGDYPDGSIYMIQHFLNNNFSRLNYARLSVASVFTFLLIFAFTIIMFIVKKKAGEYEL